MRVLLIHNDYQQLGGETLAFDAEADFSEFLEAVNDGGQR